MHRRTCVCDYYFLFVTSFVCVHMCINILTHLCTGRESCAAAGGTCHTERDGYFYVVGACVCVGAALILLLKKFFVPLQHAPDSAWRARSSFSSSSVSPAPKQSID